MTFVFVVVSSVFNSLVLHKSMLSHLYLKMLSDTSVILQCNGTLH